MARYRVLARSYIGRMVEPGDIVEWDGVAGTNLQRLGTPRRGRRSPVPPRTVDPKPSDPVQSDDRTGD